MKEQFGKVNTMHAHTLPWVDVPLVMKNLLGGEEGLNDSGVSVSKLLLNPLFFLEATGEVYQGNSGPFQTHERSDVSWLGRLRGYRDITEGTNLDIGASFTRRSQRRRARYHDAAVRRRCDRALSAAAPRNLSPLHGTDRVDVEPPGAGDRGRRRPSACMSAVITSLRGAGLLACASTGPSARLDASLVDKGPSLVVTYWPSEFSQIRGQYRRTHYAEGVTANELLFQFLFSIGAHGAHVF